MPRAEAGTPKYLANRMKSKGLQKLRWYCQMCQKQCRDENGFKCHTMSESHQRQLLLFADNSKKYIDDFSYEFAKEYLQILRRQYGTKRVNANKVYQEYISYKNHLHMNSTRWVTLTGFVKWLGRTGKCLVDETEKGWFITYVDRDPETIAKEEKRNKKIKMDKDDEERSREFVEKQVQLARERENQQPPTNVSSGELKRDENDEPLKLNLKLAPVQQKLQAVSELLVKDSTVTKKRPRKANVHNEGGRSSALDEIREQEEHKKELANRKDYWLAEGIVVKIMTKSLGESFYKQKGVVRRVESRYAAIIKMLESGHKVRLDQEHLETVIPAIGKHVRIVNGAYRGETATLLSLDEKKFCVNVKIASGLLMGRVVEGIQYEDICKIFEDHVP